MPYDVDTDRCRFGHCDAGLRWSGFAWPAKGSTIVPQCGCGTWAWRLGGCRLSCTCTQSMRKHQKIDNVGSMALIVIVRLKDLMARAWWNASSMQWTNIYWTL